MATDHFVKDGKRPNGVRITRSVDVPINLAMDQLGKFGRRHGDTAPTINPEVQASDWAA